MKYLALFLLIPFLMSAQADEATIAKTKWLTDYDTALKKAKKANKNVLVYFTGSDWCPPCKKLKTDFFDSAEFAALSEKFVLLYIDVPMNKDLLTPDQLEHNKALSAKLNRKGAVPLIKILDKKGKALDDYSGYSMNGDTRYHIELLERNQSTSK